MYDRWLITVSHQTFILVCHLWWIHTGWRDVCCSKEVNIHCSRYSLIGQICSPCVVTLVFHFHQKHHSCYNHLHLCSSVLCSLLETSFFRSYSPIHEKRLKECHTQQTSITTFIQRYSPINSQSNVLSSNYKDFHCAWHSHK